MEYIIFGLTADPFTKAHGYIVEMVAAKHPDAQILIVPSVVTWHRKDKSALFDEPDRRYIINYWLSEKMPKKLSGTVDIDDHEYMLPDFLREGRGFIDYLRYFVETKESIRTEKNTYRFVIGEDEWAIFDQWKNHEEILRLATPIVVRRGNAAARPISKVDGMEVIDLPDWCAEVSASAIRAKLVGSESKLRAYCNTSEFWTFPREVLLLRAPIFDVVSAESDIPDFHPIRVKSPDWVCIIVRKPDGDFLTVRQKRWGTGEIYDEFVTGMVDKDEFPYVAAKRELAEETGIVADKLDVLGYADANPGFMSNAMYYFFIDLGDGKTPWHQENQRLGENENLTVTSLTEQQLRSEPHPALMLAGIALLDRYLKAKER